MTQWKAIAWTCHAETTVVVDEPEIFLGKRLICECDTPERAAAIVGMRELTERIARLNPDAGEIGAGMLAQLVAQARGLIE